MKARTSASAFASPSTSPQPRAPDTVERFAKLTSRRVKVFVSVVECRRFNRFVDEQPSPKSCSHGLSTLLPRSSTPQCDAPSGPTFSAMSRGVIIPLVIAEVENHDPVGAAGGRKLAGVER